LIIKWGAKPMNNKPFFSVIIPTLNEEKFLPRLLSNLSAQIDKDFEVLVVDAESSDNTIHLAQKFDSQLPSFQTINFQVPEVSHPVTNVSSQRNLGAQKSSAEYLVFLDADVQIPSNFLSQIHHFLLENPNVKFASTWIIPDSNNQADKAMATVVNFVLELSRTIDKPMIPGFNIIIKKDTFQKIGGFNEKVKLAEDHDLAQRLHKKNISPTFLKSPKLTASFRRLRREGTLTIMRKYAQATSKILLEGPITKDLFEYHMGGNIPRTNKIKIQTKLKKYFKALANSL